MRALTLITRTLAAAAAIRVCVLFGEFWLGRPDVHAYHVESASTIFVVLAALAWWLGGRESAGDSAPARPRDTPARWLLFIALAFALYATALPVGLLSDDFVLITRAHDWQLGAVASYAFRPIAMTLWALFDHAGLAIPVFHAFIIALHGVLAFLTVRVASAWVTSAWAPMLAGAFMLTFPVAVEPVVWLANGFENVTMAALVLMAVLVSRRYGDQAALRNRVLCAALVLAAALAKETGAVAGVLILIDAFARRRLTRALMIDAGVFTTAGIAYGAMRLAGATDAPPHELSLYTLRRTIFQTFGGLAQQWPGTSHALAGPLAIVSVVLVLGIIVAATLEVRRETARAIVSAAGWIFVSVMPVFGWILIGSNLRDSRWLYLAAPAWAIALAAMVASPAQRLIRAASVAAAVMLIALNVVAVRWQIGAWVRAGDLRDRALLALEQNQAARACASVRLTDLPDNVDGAYVMLNGVGQASARARTGVTIDATAPAGCHFRWNGTAFIPSN
jgi:hypothetical protein